MSGGRRSYVVCGGRARIGRRMCWWISESLFVAPCVLANGVFCYQGALDHCKELQVDTSVPQYLTSSW